MAPASPESAPESLGDPSAEEGGASASEELVSETAEASGPVDVDAAGVGGALLLPQDAASTLPRRNGKVIERSTANMGRDGTAQRLR